MLAYARMMVLVGCVLTLLAACDSACPEGTHRVAKACARDFDGGTATESTADTAAMEAEGGAGGHTSSTSGGAGAAGTDKPVVSKHGAGGKAGAEQPSASEAGVGGSSEAGRAAAPAGGAGHGASAAAGASAAGMSAPQPMAGSAAPCVPSSEVCDNADNDCDSKIDEGVTKACGSNIGACRPGVLACHAGVWDDEKTQCQGSVQPQPEVCDSARQDENCDGVGNEGCACSEGETTSCGNKNAPCHEGTLTCKDGQWPPMSACQGDVKPGSETCDGVDNDCDTRIDNGSLCSAAQVCGGALGCVDCMEDGDCSRMAAATCKVNVCNASSHRCESKDAAQRSPCTSVANGKCDSGKCVACLAGDCPTNYDCILGACVKQARCGDSVVDPGEECDDGNSSDEDGCVAGCKRNVCGDKHWNKATEPCELGAISGLAPAGRVWDQWTCDAQCKRRFVFTPCSTDAECGQLRCVEGRFCAPSCPDTSSTGACSAEGVTSGICASGTCLPLCHTDGATEECPANSACTLVSTVGYCIPRE